MSKFPAWFNRAYKQWSRSQPGEEDFLAFCNLLGYPPAKVLDWLHGESTPEGAEVLSIAGVLGINVYKALDLPKPDPDLIKILDSFPHLTGQGQSMLALAIFETGKRLKEENILPKSFEAKKIFKSTFEKYGLKK